MLQPPWALAAVKQEMLEKSISVGKPSTAYVEGIDPEDFIFCSGLLFPAHFTLLHYSQTSDFQDCLLLQMRLPSRILFEERP